MIDDHLKSFLQMHCKDTMVELDVDPEDPEVLIMTCLVSTDHNIDHDDNDMENLKFFLVNCFSKLLMLLFQKSTFPPPNEYDFGRSWCT